MTEPADPVVWTVRGNPSDEELAAVVTVLSALSAPGQARAGNPVTSGWSAYWRAVRAPLPPGPDAWRASGRPR